MGPIIELEDGATIIAQVVDVRETDGEYKGHLIDMLGPGEIAFSVNGHTILKDKVEQFYVGAPEWFEITRSGMAGRAVNYQVQRIDCSTEELLADDSEREGLNASAAYIQEHIDAIPPRD